jgi:hypothetical protein
MLKRYGLFRFFVFQIAEMRNMLERPFSKAFSGFRESGLRDAKWPDPLSADPRYAEFRYPPFVLSGLQMPKCRNLPLDNLTVQIFL